ncbi:MAG: hypothetical protein LPJ95_07525 [Paracoccaceae bacterium]|nr:hypothetical protein [Paracoccaceae bacterium]
MSPDYQVAALWIGGKLSFLEELCLKSFVDAGHHTILFTYEGTENVPDGVELRDGAEIMPNPKIIRHSRTGSPAPFADKFRYRMLAQLDRTIWADTDAYCCKPFVTSTGHFHGYEKEGEVNNGVLGLPKDSETLRALLAFTEDEYAIPEWLPASVRQEYADAKAAGRPVSSGEMSWGIWGPQALSHFLKKTGEIRHSMPQTALYPVPYSKRGLLAQPGADLSEFITPETFSIHFYGRRMRARLSERFGGVPRPRSLIGKLLKKHGIDPTRNPLPDRTLMPATEAEDE